MRIIDNKKDYYDYLVSKWGLDNSVIYDRRNSVVLAKDISSFFYNNKLHTDTERTKYKGWYYRTYPNDDKIHGNLKNIIIKLGNKYLSLWIDRYIENDKLKFNLCYISEIESIKNMPDIPLSIAINNRNKLEWSGNIILKDTFLSKILDPEEVYLNIYDYLIKQKDKEITDSRTDIQKLESAGFDKTISFRGK